MDFAGRVEGMPRHTSTHAAGVVITPGELTNYVPLQITSTSMMTMNISVPSMTRTVPRP